MSEIRAKLHAAKRDERAQIVLELTPAMLLHNLPERGRDKE